MLRWSFLATNVVAFVAAVYACATPNPGEAEGIINTPNTKIIEVRPIGQMSSDVATTEFSCVATDPTIDTECKIDSKTFTWRIISVESWAGNGQWTGMQGSSYEATLSEDEAGQVADDISTEKVWLRLKLKVTSTVRVTLGVKAHWDVSSSRNTGSCSDVDAEESQVSAQFVGACLVLKGMPRGLTANSTPRIPVLLKVDGAASFQAESESEAASHVTLDSTTTKGVFGTKERTWDDEKIKGGDHLNGVPSPVPTAGLTDTYTLFLDNSKLDGISQGEDHRIKDITFNVEADVTVKTPDGNSLTKEGMKTGDAKPKYAMDEHINVANIGIESEMDPYASGRAKFNQRAKIFAWQAASGGNPKRWITDTTISNPQKLTTQTSKDMLYSYQKHMTVWAMTNSGSSGGNWTGTSNSTTPTTPYVLDAWAHNESMPFASSGDYWFYDVDGETHGVSLINYYGQKEVDGVGSVLDIRVTKLNARHKLFPGSTLGFWTAMNWNQNKGSFSGMNLASGVLGMGGSALAIAALGSNPVGWVAASTYVIAVGVTTYTAVEIGNYINDRNVSVGDETVFCQGYGGVDICDSNGTWESPVWGSDGLGGPDSEQFLLNGVNTGSTTQTHSGQVYVVADAIVHKTWHVHHCSSAKAGAYYGNWYTFYGHAGTKFYWGGSPPSGYNKLKLTWASETPNSSANPAEVVAESSN